MVPRRRQRTSPLTALLIVLLCVIVLAAALMRGSLSGLLWRALAPVVAFRDSFSGGQVAELKAELASTTAALADRDRLADENARLRAELGRPDAAHTLVLAGVLMRPPGTPYDTLILDAGTREGVAVGNRVIAGSLGIGIIDEVYPTTSRVVLYSAPGQSYDGVIETSGTQGAVPVTIEGQGGGSLSARVPAATEVEVGDRVAFPGLDGALVGAVAAISGADTDTFKTVYLRLPADPFSLTRVFIQK